VTVSTHEAVKVASRNFYSIPCTDCLLVILYYNITASFYKQVLF